MTKKYSGTFIGLMFSLSSFLATWTFIFPLLTVLPLGLFLESIFKSSGPYSVIGPYILTTLWVIFITTSAAFFLYAYVMGLRGKAIPKLSFVIFLVLQLFIVHPLVFYIDTSPDWDRASDGQFILGIANTFPTSSFAFVCFGILLDLVRMLKKPKQEEKTE